MRSGEWVREDHGRFARITLSINRWIVFGALTRERRVKLGSDFSGRNLATIEVVEEVFVTELIERGQHARRMDIVEVDFKRSTKFVIASPVFREMFAANQELKSHPRKLFCYLGHDGRRQTSMTGDPFFCARLPTFLWLRKSVNEVDSDRPSSRVNQTTANTGLLTDNFDPR